MWIYDIVVRIVWYDTVYYVFSSYPKFRIYFSIADHIGCGCLLLILETQMDGLSPSQGTRSIPLCMVDHATLIEATGQGIGWMDWTIAICNWCYWYHLMAHIGLSTARTNQTKLSNPADMLSKIVSVQSCGRSFFYQRLQAALPGLLAHVFTWNFFGRESLLK